MAIAYVGERGTGAATQANPATLSVSSSATAGNTIILIMGCRDSRILPSGITITDSRSNTWVLDVEECDNSLNNYAGIFRTTQDGGTLQSGDTLTVTFGTSPTGPICYFIEEFSGVAVLSTLDQSGKGIDDVLTTGATVTCGGSTHQAVELAVTGFMCNNGPGIITRDPTWTDFTTGEQYDSTNSKALDVQYNILSSKTTPSATFTWGTNASASSRVIASYFSIVNGHILTEGSDYIDTEGSDRLVTEDFVSTGTTYTDSASGTITLSGSSVEVHLYPDSATGTITLSGSATDHYSENYTDSQSGTITLSGSATDNHFILYTDSRSGTITLSGSATDANSNAASQSGTITFSGSETDHLTYTNSGSGTITLSGSATDHWGIIYTDSKSGTITLSGSATSSSTYADSRSGQISLSGSSSLISAFVDSMSGALTWTGYDIEHIFGVILPPFILYGHTGLARLNNIEQWLHDNTSFLWADHKTEYTELNRLVNIEQYLIANPVGTPFMVGDRAGTDRLWAIESYLLAATGNPVYFDMAAGTLTVTGSGVENFEGTYPDSGSGTLTLSGSSVEHKIFTNSGSGTVTLSGSSTEQKVFIDSASGTLTLSGSATEVYYPLAPLPPASYSLPMTYTLVSSSSAFITALAGATQNIVLADGTYDNSSAFTNPNSSSIYAQNLGGATLTAGLSMSGSGGGAIVQGIKQRITTQSKCENYGGVYAGIMQKAGSNNQFLDLDLDGGNVIHCGIFARGSGIPGIKIERQAYANYLWNGLRMTDDNKVAYHASTGIADTVSDISVDTVAWSTTLAASMSSSATTATTTAAVTSNGNTLLVVDGEQMTITGGFGTTSLTVTRGGSPASHASGAVAFSPGNTNGTAETGLWIGHPVTNGVSRILSKNCAISPLWTGNNSWDTTFTDLDLDAGGLLQNGGEGIYCEHNSYYNTYQRFRIVGAQTGVEMEYDYGTPGDEACQYPIVQDGTISTTGSTLDSGKRVGVMADEGTLSPTVQRVTFIGQDFAAICNYLNAGTPVNSNNDYSQIAMGAATISTGHP